MTTLRTLCKIRGYKIVDASEPLNIKVEGVDVRNALATKSKRCVVANAIYRQGKRIHAYDFVHVLRTAAYTREFDSKEVKMYTVPTVLMKEITRYDKTGKFRLDKYTIVPPSTSKSMKARARANRRLRDLYKKRPSGPHHKSENTKRVGFVARRHATL